MKSAEMKIDYFGSQDIICTSGFTLTIKNSLNGSSSRDNIYNLNGSNYSGANADTTLKNYLGNVAWTTPLIEHGFSLSDLYTNDDPNYCDTEEGEYHGTISDEYNATFIWDGTSWSKKVQ